MSSREEARALREALRTYRSVSAAAEGLGLSRSTLARKMKRYRIPAPPRGRPRIAIPRRQGRGMPPRAAAQFAVRLRALQVELQPQLPEVDPHDLHLILERMLHPIGKRRFFIHRRKEGGYVF